ncbi:hypothetical protein [Variovorax ginsengisoli]|uniref:Ribosomal protein S3AE n=1 Tax=Variovorax ginsengisoli TaxID=363844 RepID=A0ABT9SAG2_9BURK|nr:hypothetical protein [Variovorax ginsengisoli]MDP9900828.1 hypothetical protein [Variovorax ginsengisoli]
MTTHPTFPLRTECPPGACVCARKALLQATDGDLRVLQLTREQEKRLIERLENVRSLAELRHVEARMADQLGIRLRITASPNEVRTLKGIAILVLEQPGLCKKSRQAIPAAIRKSMDRHPQIAYDLLDEDGLFAFAPQP